MQKDKPELLGILEGVLVHAVSHLQDSTRERDGLEQALRRYHWLKVKNSEIHLRCYTLYFAFVPLFFFFLKDGRTSTINSFAPYMKKWTAKSERRGTSGRARYRRVTFYLGCY